VAIPGDAVYQEIVKAYELMHASLSQLQTKSRELRERRHSR